MLQGSITPQAAPPDRSARDAASALADEAWGLVGADPRKAQRIAVRALSAANAARNPRAASVAHRALGMTAIELRGADEALAHLRRAIAAGRRAESAQLVAEAEMTLALALQLSGDASAALRHAGSAMRAAPQSARLGLQQALILERSGRLSQALERYAVVERLAVVTGDQDTLARVLGNRGVLQIYLGDYPAAADDILRAEALCQELGLTLMVAAARANLGYLAARRGNVVEALRWLERARPELEAAGDMRHGIFQFDLCEVLLAAGLWRDAVSAGRGAIELLTRTGMQAELAEARLLTAQAALRDGDPATAEHLATAAGRAFSRQRRAPWAALAREVVVRAQWASGRRDEAMLASARRVAASLDEAGWATNGSSARILAARLALELGRPQIARTELERASAHDQGPAWMRIQALHGRALLCSEHGDAQGAETALHAGWTAIEEHRSTLGATELRIGASAHTSELAELGVRLALRSGSPEGVLRWAERGRAGMLDRPAAHAPADARLATKLDELRAVVATLESAAKDGEDTRGLVSRQAQLEDEVRSQARLADASARDAGVLDVDPDALHDALGERALAELVVCDGTLWAVVAAE
ncbi:MAG: hypothetical protein JHD16_11570, partial [Solirubrobacteraceae bacterium]|nr:hypothetical protein [Solirubrobacteraceae bacterium]